MSSSVVPSVGRSIDANIRINIRIKNIRIFEYSNIFVTLWFVHLLRLAMSQNQCGEKYISDNVNFLCPHLAPAKYVGSEKELSKAKLVIALHCTRHHSTLNCHIDYYCSVCLSIIYSANTESNKVHCTGLHCSEDIKCIWED